MKKREAADSITDAMCYDYFITRREGRKVYDRRHKPFEFKPYDGKTPIVLEDRIRVQCGLKHKNILRKLFQDEIDKTLVHIGSQWVNTMSLMKDYEERKTDPHKFLKYWVMFYRPSQYSPSPSIYSPQVSLAIMIYYNFKGHILTPTMGWGTWLMAAAHNPAISTYHGIDVIPSVITKSKTFANELGQAATFHCKPSEDIKSTELRPADSIIFSPPYFQLEIYPDDGNLVQSTERYKEIDKWIEGYWEPTVKLCKDTLKDDGTMCVIFKQDKDGGMMLDVLENYFDIFDRKPLMGGGAKTAINPETLYACRKKSA